MNFKLTEAIEILERTPNAMEAFLSGLSNSWLTCNEGNGTWNVMEVIDHLIECENGNWIPRLEAILQYGENRPFPPFDRYTHLKQKVENSVEEKLFEFRSIRFQNIKKLKDTVQRERDLQLTGIHPEFGVVKLSELISTWAVHDLTHIAQIVRIMAKRYRQDVGPWNEYLGILKRNK